MTQAASTVGQPRARSVPIRAARPRAVVFDLDGTLVATEPLYRAAFDRAAAHWGVSVSNADYRALVGLASRDRAGRLAEAFGPAVPVVGFLQTYRLQKAQAMAAGIPLRTGALHTLQALRWAGVPCAIATSAGRRTATAILARTGLAAHVRHVVTRDDVSRGKPDPETYRLVASALGVAAADAVALEDSEPGLRSARAAGFRAIRVADAPHPAHDAPALVDLRDLLRMFA